MYIIKITLTRCIFTNRTCPMFSHLTYVRANLSDRCRINTIAYLLPYSRLRLYQNRGKITTYSVFPALPLKIDLIIPLRGIIFVSGARPPSADEHRQKSHLDFDVDAGGQVKVHQGVYDLWCWRFNIYQSLVGPHLKLFARILINEARAVDRILMDLGRQRDGTDRLAAIALNRIHDLGRRLIYDLVIVGL